MNTDWLVNFRPHAEAQMRLFCIPYAGGGVNIYRSWADKLYPDIEVIGIQFPGHGTRFKEAAYTRLVPAIHALLPIIQPHLNTAFALFGHSLGGLLAYNLARELSSKGYRISHVILSGCKPRQKEGRSGIHSLPDTQFLEKLRQLDGTPEEVFANPELLEIVMPVLRADFAMAETIDGPENGQLSCPITSVAGEMDASHSPMDLEDWRSYTSTRFEGCTLPGGHFFIESAEDSLLKIVQTAILPTA